MTIGLRTVALAMPETLTPSAFPEKYFGVCINCGHAVREDSSRRGVRSVWRHAKGGFIRCPEPRKGWPR